MRKDIVVPVTSALVALAGVLSGVYVQRSAAWMQLKTKEYEISFLTKQKGYGEVVRLLGDCEKNLVEGDQADFSKNIAALQTQYLSLEPFIKRKTSRDVIWNSIVKLR